jgi:outer membrane receptor protein involved in Fe transport
MKKNNTLNFLKIRASYAQVKGGLTSPTIGPAGYPIGYGQAYSSPYDGPSYTNSSVYSTPLLYNGKPSANFTNTVSNSSLKPFQRTNYEAGFEARLMKNRLGVEGTYFVYNDGPGIYQRTVSEATGYTNQLVNGIETQRKGWELSLNGEIVKPSKKGGLSWNSSANLSRYREFLTKIYGDVDRISANYFPQQRNPIYFHICYGYLLFNERAYR